MKAGLSPHSSSGGPPCEATARPWDMLLPSGPGDRATRLAPNPWTQDHRGHVGLPYAWHSPLGYRVAQLLLHGNSCKTKTAMAGLRAGRHLFWV